MQRIFEKTGFICLTLMLSLVWASSLYGAVTYTYDDRNRLVSTDYNDGQMVITYAYNSNGSRVSKSIPPDTDEDGLLDALETDPGVCTLYDDADTDDDGILDGTEDANRNGVFDAGETDPCDDDTDDDGLLDGEEDLNGDGAVDEGETDPCDTDTDADGMPDGWEVEYGLDPLDATDADADADFDRVTNLDEYTGGTDPTSYHICTGTIYVDPAATGSDNGTSWDEAFTSLQDALRAAGSIAGDFPEVWVAGGTYYPDEGTGVAGGVSDPRDLTFNIASGVKVYGGFAGAEATAEERDWEANETILNGDLNRDDTGEFSLFQDNVYSVVSFIGVSNQTVLDGFTITAGFAVSDAMEMGHEMCGGGIYNYTEGEGNTGSPQIANCTISGNLGLVGGGMVNLAVDGGTGSPAMTNCIFSSNTADSDGGGMCNTGMNGGIANPVLVDCTFSNNSSANGGGMANQAWGGTGSPTMTDCIFDNNMAYYGGGMLNSSRENGSICKPSMTNCIFSNNMADYFGGGMANEGSDGGISNPELISCSFNGNASVDGGGMMNMADNGTTSPNLINCVFSNNMADYGGGVESLGSNGGISTPALINCTISNNSATFEGGGINNNKEGGSAAVNPDLVNTILWSNQAPTGPEVFNDGGAAPLFAYCDIENSGGSDAWDTALGADNGNNIDADPLFADAAGGDLRLRAGSPCVDAGDNAANPEPADLGGELRIQNETIDLGAYECVFDITIYENAEDGTINGWDIYDNNPADATITNVADSGNQAIQFIGDGTANGYRLRLEDGGKWNNKTQFVARWRMNYSENFTLYFDCETSNGHRYIYYKPRDVDYLGTGEYVHHGLGADAADSTWRTFERNIAADLADAQPDNTLLEINGFLIRGSGMVDDISLNR
ncbi:MAG: choice-of-anchor Q domain-containing protein [Thermodesulfobacteriota bacterium]|nr:choice-of-anchor Q domain-containing protein [Thermodesulfobacteriota bacterium]